MKENPGHHSKRTSYILGVVFVICLCYISIHSWKGNKSSSITEIASNMRRTDPVVLRGASQTTAESFAAITNKANVISVDSHSIGTKFTSENLNNKSPVPFSSFSNICLDSKVKKFIAYGTKDKSRPFHMYGLYYGHNRAYTVETQSEASHWKDGDRWLPGTTILVAERHEFGMGVENFFHSMEHLSGTWLMGGHTARDDVKHVVYLMPGYYAPDSPNQYKFFGQHEMTPHTIKAMYKNAQILTWESLLATAEAAPSGRLCMPISIISDRALSYEDNECMRLNKMLANMFPVANHQDSLAMASALWDYSSVKPLTIPDLSIERHRKRKIRLLYTTRHSKRVFSDELDTKIVALLSSIPGVELVIADFSTFPFVEQVSRIAQSDILFGLHGSGLTHLLWLPQHATVVEIFPEDTFAIDYRAFARLRGLDYVGLQAQRGPTKPIPDGEAFRTGAYGHMANKVVKVLDLYAVLNVIEKVKNRVLGEVN
jgi:hypothetical protein